MNKKIVTVLMLAVFIAGIVPFAMAEGDTEDTGRDKSKQISVTSFDKSRGEMMQRAEPLRETLKEKREAVLTTAKIQHEELKAARERIREEFKADAAKLQELRQQLKDKRKELKQQREAEHAALLQAREKMQACKNAEECALVKAQVRANSNRFLVAAAGQIISVLERARERIESAGLGEEDKAALTGEIDSSVNELATLKQALEQMEGRITKEDLASAAKQLRAAKTLAEKAIKTSAGMSASKRIGGVIVQCEKLSAKFERTMEKLKQKGKDTAAAEAKKADFDAKLSAAKDLISEAEAFFAEHNVQSATEKLRAAHTELKAARDLLKGIVQEIRGIGGAKALEEQAKAADEPGPAEAQPAEALPAEAQQAQVSQAEPAQAAAEQVGPESQQAEDIKAWVEKQQEEQAAGPTS